MNIPALFDSPDLESGTFVITTDPAVRAFFWKFPNAEFAGSDCALLPRNAADLIKSYSAPTKP